MAQKPGTVMDAKTVKAACFDASFAAASGIDQAVACRMHKANQEQEKRKGKILAPSHAVSHKMKR